MTDIELLDDIGLLELAALAADIYDALLEPRKSGFVLSRNVLWKPVEPHHRRRRCALRLAVTLKIDDSTQWSEHPLAASSRTGRSPEGLQVWEDSGSDPLAATRRAIVSAAAEIGKNDEMKQRTRIQCTSKPEHIRATFDATACKKRGRQPIWRGAA
jgi:hypothetical protein